MSKSVRTPFSWRFASLLATLFVAALLLDSLIPSLFAPHYRVFKYGQAPQALKYLGHAYCAIAIFVLLALFHPRRFRAGGQLVASLLIGAVFEAFIKWGVGRTRPMARGVINIEPFSFDWFRGGPTGLMHQANLCFPSGHATSAFATAACLCYLCPRWGWLWYLPAFLVGIERVAELAHYPSDVVGGLIVGTISASIARWLFTSWDAPAPIDPSPREAANPLQPT